MKIWWSEKEYCQIRATKDELLELSAFLREVAEKGECDYKKGLLGRAGNRHKTVVVDLVDKKEYSGNKYSSWKGDPFSILENSSKRLVEQLNRNKKEKECQEN